MTIENGVFDIKDLIEETIKPYYLYAGKKGLKLSFMFSYALPQIVIGDPKRLQLVLNKIISNVLNFTEKGEIAITVKEISSTNEIVEFEFSVSCIGIGIEPNEMNRFFNSFNQIDSSFTCEHENTGLGILISAQFVKKMDGNIWVTHEKDKGSTFHFTVKFKTEDQLVKKLEEPIKILKALDTLHILLVEDNKINQKVISLMLKNKGYLVDIASNGIEALIMHNEKTYDIILMDIQMPEMDGIEATKHIRQREGKAKYTPIVAITANALDGDRERYLSMGIDDYLAKPIHMNDLFYMLDRVISQKDFRFAINGIQLSVNDNNSFTEEKIVKIHRDKLTIYIEIADYIKELNNVLDNSDFELIEVVAHKIKNLFNKADADELKSSAFMIELAARRGSLKEAVEYTRQLERKFETFKKASI